MNPVSFSAGCRQRASTRFPFAYCDEVWTGVEYQVATNLIHAGLIKEGFTVVKALRSRYDGFRRNPWSEIEAGHHYIRAMASFGLLTAYAGYRADFIERDFHFSPKVVDGEFKTFWICGRAWGPSPCTTPAANETGPSRSCTATWTGSTSSWPALSRQ